MLLTPQPIMHLMHSHPSMSPMPPILPLSPISPWGKPSVAVPPNTPTSANTSHQHVKSHHHSSSPSATEIIPRLYLSDLADAENPAVLSSLGITHVFSAMPGFVDCPSHIKHHQTGRSIPIHRAQIQIEDNPFAELAAHLPTSTAFIRDALSRDPEAKVLVHCVLGVSRSASVVAAYLMASHGWTPVQAVAYVKAKRRVAEPNFGFVTQLHEYEKALQATTTTTTNSHHGHA